MIYILSFQSVIPDLIRDPESFHSLLFIDSGSSAGMTAFLPQRTHNPPPISPSLMHKGGGLKGWVILM
jgi:hypothetical protein